MDFVDVLNSEFFVKTYSIIEEEKRKFPVNHGFKHVNNVIGYAQKLAEIFHLTEDEKRLLLIACALHDTGYINGRENHGGNGAIIARDFLLQNNFNEDEIKTVCRAIQFHSGKSKETFENKIGFCLAFADKLDFTRDRYNEDISKYPAVAPFLNILSNQVGFQNKIITVQIFYKNGFSEAQLQDDCFFKKLMNFFKLTYENLEFRVNVEYVLKNEEEMG